MKLHILFLSVVLLLAACSPASPFDFDISGALDFDLKAVSVDKNSTGEYAILYLMNSNPDVERATAGAYINIYGLDVVGAGDYEVRDFPGSYNEPNIVVSVSARDREDSFSQNTSGTFRVTAFDGTTLSVTFDFTVQDKNGAEVRLRGTINNIPFNGEVYSG